MAAIERLGAENFDAIRATLAARGIDAAWGDAGVIDVATREHEVPWLAEAAETAREHGDEVALLDREAVRAEVDSPTYLAGPLASDRQRARGPRAARVGPARGGAGRRRAHPRAHPGDETATGR